MNPHDLTYHHLGIAVCSIDEAQIGFTRMGFEPESKVINDPVLGVSVKFLKGHGQRLELVANFGEATTISSFLKPFPVAYHMGFETSDLEADLNRVVRSGGRIIVGPTPALAFGGRRVSFVAHRDAMLYEYIERAQ